MVLNKALIAPVIEKHKRAFARLAASDMGAWPENAEFPIGWDESDAKGV